MSASSIATSYFVKLPASMHRIFCLVLCLMWAGPALGTPLKKEEALSIRSRESTAQLTATTLTIFAPRANGLSCSPKCYHAQMKLSQLVHACLYKLILWLRQLPFIVTLSMMLILSRTYSLLCAWAPAWPQ